MRNAPSLLWDWPNLPQTTNLLFSLPLGVYHSRLGGTGTLGAPKCSNRLPRFKCGLGEQVCLRCPKNTKASEARRQWQPAALGRLTNPYSSSEALNKVARPDPSWSAAGLWLRLPWARPLWLLGRGAWEGVGAERPLSGQHSLRGEGERAGPGGSLRSLLRQSRRGGSGPSQRRRTGHRSGWERRWELPRAPGLPSPLPLRPLVLGSAARPSSSAPLLLSEPLPAPRLCWSSGATRLQLTGLESRLGAPDCARPRARSLLLPPPRAPRGRRRRRLRLLRAGPRPCRRHRCRRRASPPPPPSTMGDAGSERSKAPSLPPRCPCGFWG